jgi:hypothetical protein
MCLAAMTTLINRSRNVGQKRYPGRQSLSSNLVVSLRLAFDVVAGVSVLFSVAILAALHVVVGETGIIRYLF